MFGFLRKKPKKTQEIPLGELNDASLVESLKSYFRQQNDIVCALFLIAHENFPVYFSVFSEAAKSSKDLPGTLEGMAAFLDVQRQKYSGTSISDQVNSRRFFYLYLVALLKTLHARAKVKPELWDATAAIWVSLLPGARAIRRVIDSTRLWSPDEVEWFKDIRSEQDGEKHCLDFMAPSEIRHHQIINEWLEKDLQPDIKAELHELEKLIRGQ
jgi:hypothetical protein